MENKILKIIKESLDGSIKSVLTGYHSPLLDLIKKVFEDNEGHIRHILDDEFSNALKGSEFRKTVRAGLDHKLGKLLIAKFGGELEKQINVLKSNPETRAKITLAITKITDEVLQGEK